MSMLDDLFRRLSERWQKPGIARHVVGSALQDVVFHRQKVGIVAVWRKQSHRVNIRALSDMIRSARLSFTQFDRVRSELGVETDTVTPFASSTTQMEKLMSSWMPT